MTKYIDPYDIPAEASPEINQPVHYKLWGTTEAIDIMQSVLTPDEFKGYLKGNILKYRLRAGKKDNVEKDIAKAKWYESKIKSVEGKKS